MSKGMQQLRSWTWSATVFLSFGLCPFFDSPNQLMIISILRLWSIFNILGWGSRLLLLTFSFGFLRHGQSNLCCWILWQSFGSFVVSLLFLSRTSQTNQDGKPNHITVSIRYLMSPSHHDFEKLISNYDWHTPRRYLYSSSSEACILSTH